MVRAESLVADARFAEALALLEKTPRPSGNHGTTWTLFTAEAAAGSGHVDRAYAALLDSAVALPDARADAAWQKYGTTLGKTHATSTPISGGCATPRPRSPRRSNCRQREMACPAKLADYRGRVVLLAFWFPGCLGCREEFPHLQQVLEKYESRGLTMLAINREPTQRKSVLSLLQAMGITLPRSSPTGRGRTSRTV